MIIMKKLLIATALLATTGLMYAESGPVKSAQNMTDHENFYGIEDYNDPLYGDAYDKKTAAQTIRTK
jgi:hypothetical protein